MRMATVFIIAFILLSPNLIRAEEIKLTLDEAVAIALRNNRDVLLKTEDVKKAKEKIKEAKSGLWPSINFSASWQDTRGLYPKDVASIKTQTTLQQPLYKGGKTINTIKYDEYGLTVTESILDKVKLETVLNVEKAFYTLLLAQEFVYLNKEILNNVKAHLVSLEARYQSGQVSQSEILNIKKSLSTIEEAYQASLNQVESSVSLLKNLLYLEENIDIKPEGKFTYEPQDVAYEEGFLKAMSKRPEIKQFEAQEKQAKTSVDIAKSGTRPSIYASWDYYSSSVSQLGFTPSKAPNDHHIIGINFSWPLFDGWATKAKVEQAIVDLKEAQLAKQKLMKDIATELKNAYISLKNAIAGIKTAESEFALYGDNLSVIKQKYNDGIVSFLDLDDAVLSYNISMFNQKQAIYDYNMSKSSFDKATGGL